MLPLFALHTHFLYILGGECMNKVGGITHLQNIAFYTPSLFTPLILISKFLMLEKQKILDLSSIT